MDTHLDFTLAAAFCQHALLRHLGCPLVDRLGHGPAWHAADLSGCFLGLWPGFRADFATHSAALLLPVFWGRLWSLQASPPSCFLEQAQKSPRELQALGKEREAACAVALIPVTS